MKLVCFGLNHRTAPVDVREGWALSAEESRAMLDRLAEAVSPSEHVVLSTCNRTEFYSHVPYAGLPGPSRPGRGDAAESIEAHARFYSTLYTDVNRGARGCHGAFDASHFYCHVQDRAVEHLFRLAAGLDSMILGESQILKQIKDAYALAQDAQSAGKLFHRLFPAALRAGKRVRSLTAISDGCITPGQAGLKLAREVLGDLSRRCLLVIGSGKIAAMTAMAFREENVGELIVANRTEDRARELIVKVGTGSTWPWPRLEEALSKADVVISSTGAVDPIVPRECLSRVQERRGHRPLVLVDLAIPRDIDPQCRDLAGVHLFNIDDLNRVIQENVARRHTEVPMAEEIIREEMLAFERWMTYLQVDPVLRHMAERFEQIRLGELQAFVSQFPPELHDAVDELTMSLVKKLLHFPIQKLKSLRDLHGLNETEIAFLKRLFLADP